MLRFFTVSRLALNTNLIFEIGSNKKYLAKYCCPLKLAIANDLNQNLYVDSLFLSWYFSNLGGVVFYSFY
jgi:hypothetical protein